MDTLLLSRLQFAATIAFHFIFPPISIGLAWLLVMVEWKGWKRSDPDFVRIGKFFGKLLSVNFAIGVASGITMEFQFGTNWAQYSKFVGDIFGAPLAAEGVFAFFLESGFLGLYLFGRNKVSKRFHWFSILMVAVGSTLSAFWILVANSWMQTPAGYTLRNGRAELTDFWAAVFNPSMLPRFFHTVDAALIAGAFFMAGVSAYLILHGKDVEPAKKSLRLALVFGLVVSLLELFPFGHEHARQVAHTQPEKFAAIEGLYTSRSEAPLLVFGVPANRRPDMKAPIEIPGLLSWMVHGDPKAKVRGIEEFPPDRRPPLFATFVSFHNMILLGFYFIGVTALGVFLLWKQRLWTSRRYLKLLVYSIPLPVLACEFGWMAAEVGRQPWIVYGVLRTNQGFSPVVPAAQVLISLIMFACVAVLLFSLYVFLLVREVRHGMPEAEPGADPGQPHAGIYGHGRRDDVHPLLPRAPLGLDTETEPLPTGGAE